MPACAVNIAALPSGLDRFTNCDKREHLGSKSILLALAILSAS